MEWKKEAGEMGEEVRDIGSGAEGVRKEGNEERKGGGVRVRLCERGRGRGRKNTDRKGEEEEEYGEEGYSSSGVLKLSCDKLREVSRSFLRSGGQECGTGAAVGLENLEAGSRTETQPTRPPSPVFPGPGS